MPRRNDLNRILVIGSGPIVIGQACEFDYSGTQAIKALREEGYQVILANSNPATIMTDPELSDRVYLEPLTPEFLERIIAIEKPDAILPTMGGQTALNLALALHDSGALARHRVTMLGANPKAIRKAEDREQFRQVMLSIGLECARSGIARNLEDGKRILREIGLPAILRPSFTLGGEGGGVASNEKEFLYKLERGLFLSPTREVLVEESLLGWKEFELEVVRDHRDNAVVICSIENFDPMGVHTGDSITVAPAQTLTDREYQRLRDQAIRVIRAIGVETGGSNIQFAVNPETGKVIVIEMNPRVSRSSALASKATGFPIARVAAKLAIGYSLDELTNDITGTTPCSFEPSIDYVVTKIPRFDFEKFRPTEPWLGTQMKSVGEVMAIGRTFEESLGKALAGLETSVAWLGPLSPGPARVDRSEIAGAIDRSAIAGAVDRSEIAGAIDWERVERPSPLRLRAVAAALRAGAPTAEIARRSGIDPWFVGAVERIVAGERSLRGGLPEADELRRLKKLGWTDRAIAGLTGRSEDEIRVERIQLGVEPSFCSVDTCAAEFEAKTPYLYSTYAGGGDPPDPEAPARKPKQKVMILGGGPNRIGQGIEFDYCCVHAAMALREMGLETILVNSNPETVSTDFDISDRLYFEPLTPEHVLAIAAREKPLGAIVQFGGQTPLKIARALEQGGLRVLGTSTQSIDLAEDREKCAGIVRELEPLGLLQPEGALARDSAEALACARRLGFPLLVRPSYVLGGKSMRIVRSTEDLERWIDEAIEVSERKPVLLDRFIERATEVDVDALCDGREAVVAGLMEHIEEAGIHSGDSACSLPGFSLPPKASERIRGYACELARRFRVVGLMNAQFAVRGDQVWLLEVNPRASRTVPFVSKSVGKPVAKLAVKLMMGRSLHDLGIRGDLDLALGGYAVKAPVFPFHKFPGVDVLLSPEMRSTGEVMGRGRDFASAHAKALLAAGTELPLRGSAFLTIRDEDKDECLPIARELAALGFSLVATEGTAAFLERNGLRTSRVNKSHQGSPHCVDAISEGRYALVINTVSQDSEIRTSFLIRRAALERKIPCATVVTAARALVAAIRARAGGELEVLPL